jgi:thiosulfate/3-mercaptopyruvate sulfurtransferase
MYKAFVVSKTAIETDPHLAENCTACHRGNGAAMDKDTAHTGLNERPSDDPDLCGECHEAIAETYQTALHYTAAGLRNGVIGRFSEKEKTIFDDKVFETSCRNCHASCGDCHVKSPEIEGFCLGLLDGHRFVRKNEEKTCAFCHGGRVYPEFTGNYGVIKDVHYEKGMMCMNCHDTVEMHGDGNAYKSRKEVPHKPSCLSCHPFGSEKSDKASSSHQTHKHKLTCSACHALSTYKNCYGCHLGKGAKSATGFFLGISPRDLDRITTLRAVPTNRETFHSVSISMENYDLLPTYWDAVPHNVRKLTERTNNCYMCHTIKMGFLTASKLMLDGPEANRNLIYQPKPIP